MSSHTRDIAVWSFVTVLSAGLAVGVFYRASYGSPSIEIYPPAQAAEQVSTSTVTAVAPPTSTPASAEPGSYPVRLEIPTLGIDARVQRTGLKANGAMGTPTNFTDVAWYEPGTVPGQQGSAVIDGHVDNGLGLDGVFKRLSSIRVGDTVSVTDRDGTILNFIVTSIDYYDYQAAPVRLIFGEQGAARLRLITCEGDWVPGAKTYDRRLVVTAVLQ